MNENISFARHNLTLAKNQNLCKNGSNACSSAGLGISYELGLDTLKGVQVGAVGGGVYYEGTVVLTPGEMVEGTYNSGVFIMNQILNNSGSGALGRFVQFDYIELDGKN